MAIYHLSAKIVSRSTGRSSVAAAAYRSGSRLRDDRTGQDHDYTRKRGVEYAEIVAPAGVPDWMRDRAALWNAVECVERRRDAQLAREIEVALPREVPTARRAGLVREFVQAEFVDRGMIADFAVHVGHSRDGGEQPHAHIMLTTRELMGEGFGPKMREWNGTDKLEGWRARWAEHLNRELEREGHEGRVDHRRLEVQRAEAERLAEQARSAGNEQEAQAHHARANALDREPEPKMGSTATQMEKANVPSRRGDERRAVRARNAERRALHDQARDLKRQIAEVAHRLIEEARRRLHHLALRLEAAYRTAKLRADSRDPVPPKVQREPNRTSAIAAVTRDSLLGRAGRETGDPMRGAALHTLVGQRPTERSNAAKPPDAAALLGRAPPRRVGADERARDSDDRGR